MTHRAGGHLQTGSEATQRLFELMAESVRAGTFVRLRLTSPRLPEGSATKVSARLVELAGGSMMSVVQSFDRGDVTKNHPVDAGMAWLRKEFERSFRGALLGTLEGDWQLSLAPTRAGAARLIRHKPTSVAPPSRQHDAVKPRLLDASAQGWLRALGVLNQQGLPLAGMAGKFRQIERYVELLCHLARAEEWGVEKEWTIVDFGSGKAYLTFAVWHAFARVLGRKVRVIGVEQRSELVERSNRLASELGAESLSFKVGTIRDCELPSADAVIALHACDTATDDAIGRAVGVGARWVVVAPCCQREVRKAIRHEGSLSPLLRHGILEERLAEWLTDGLRSLYLEHAGYSTRVFEFVESEHTPKNLMISAVRAEQVGGPLDAARRISALKREFGIGDIALDSWIGGGSQAGSAMPGGAR